ncbi:Chloride channel protein 2 [Papilio machaon]|uniref:Chloride channel protein 2 n=1 Tax=Papilio machaon TaxID=76193 RepID=A0A0N1IKU1_PAPMA|nr:Chloride channel protein 2 [Papilio machaon]
MTNLHPAPGQLFRPKSILKKTNSFTLSRGLVGGGNTPLTPQPSVYTTVTGAETRIRAAFEAIFKRSTLLQDVEGGLPDQLSPSLPRSPSINKKVQLVTHSYIKLLSK